MQSGASAVARLRDEFRRELGGEPRMFRAPGRVNLIGEHTDYNEGFVLPMAIDRALDVAAAPRGDRLVRVSSAALGRTAELDLDAGEPQRTATWVDYVRGMACAIEASGVRLRGADLRIAGDLPLGAGLSSSAALEIGVGLALCAVSDARVDARALALMGVSAEHTYVGTRCGAMDQLTVALGRAGHALFIDCRTFALEPLALAFDDVAWLVCDTGVRHELASSGYNDRRADCEDAVRVLAAHIPGVRALRDVDAASFALVRARLPAKLAARAAHVISENARVIEARTALASRDLARFGALLYASHASLRDDYAVSAPELDAVVDSARATPGVFGARMTGGGFGGSAIVLCAATAREQIGAAIARDFSNRFGRAPRIFAVRASDGARELDA